MLVSSRWNAQDEFRPAGKLGNLVVEYRPQERHDRSMARLVISEKLNLNGAEQWIYLSKVNPNQPTLLFLHGGPGWADAPIAHRYIAGLESDFNLVHWDQRGCNRSFDSEADPNLVNTEQLTRDADSLLMMLRRDHGFESVTIVGHSWGSLLGLKVISQTSQKLVGYVGIGQYVNATLSEALSLEFCHESAKKMGRKDWLDQLKRLPPDFYKNLELLFKQREIVSAAGGEFKNSVTETMFSEWLESAPAQYKSNWKLMYDTCLSSCRTLWPELISTDFTKSLSDISIPVTIIHGRFDQCTNHDVAKAWFQSLRAPSKKFVTFENSAHWPHIEEQAAFVQTVRESILDWH